MTNLLILSVANRKEAALKLQEILTDSGCMIKTRLGLHSSPCGQCSNSGIIILEMQGEDAELKALVDACEKIDGIKVKLVQI